MMSRNDSTSVAFWLSLPLIEFMKWINVDNKINAELRQKYRRLADG